MASIKLLTRNILETGVVAVTGMPDVGYPEARLYDRDQSLFWKDTVTEAKEFEVDQFTEIDDETGVTEYRLSMLAGNAFAKTVGLDLTQHLGKILVLRDSVGKIAWGYIKEADEAEAPGSELYTIALANHGTHPYETLTLNGLDISQAINSAVLGICNSDISNTVGKLYKAAFDFTLNSGTNPRFVAGGGSGLDPITSDYTERMAGTDSYTPYWTSSKAAGYCGFRNEDGENVDFAMANLSIKEVVHVGTDGVHIVSASGGSTRSWTSIDSNFNPNDISTMEVVSGQIFSADFLAIPKHNFNTKVMEWLWSDNGSDWTPAVPAWTQGDNNQIIKTLEAALNHRYWKVTVGSITDPQCSEIYMSYGYEFQIRFDKTPSGVKVSNVEWKQSVGGLDRSTKFGDRRRERIYSLFLDATRLTNFRAAIDDLDENSKPFYLKDHEGYYWLCRLLNDPEEEYINEGLTPITLAVIEKL